MGNAVGASSAVVSGPPNTASVWDVQPQAEVAFEGDAWPSARLHSQAPIASRGVDLRLIHAARDGDFGALTQALADGARVEVSDGSRNTPLIWAVRSNFRDGVDALLEAKADPNVAGPGHETPLHIATQGGLERLTAVLLLAGADVNALCQASWTPLARACQRGSAATASSLLASGACLSLGDELGRGPLHWAASSSGIGGSSSSSSSSRRGEGKVAATGPEGAEEGEGSVGALPALLRHLQGGASASGAASSRGRGAYMAFANARYTGERDGGGSSGGGGNGAARGGATGGGDGACGGGGDPDGDRADTRLRVVPREHGPARRIVELRDPAPSVAAATGGGGDDIAAAARSTGPPAVKCRVTVFQPSWSPLLLQDIAGRCPLHYAASTGNAAACSLLLAARAQPLAADRDGLTPLHVAAARLGEDPFEGPSSSPLSAMMAALPELEERAGMDVRDVNGRTLLYHARLHGRTRVVQWLLSKGASQREAGEDSGQ